MGRIARLAGIAAVTILFAAAIGKAADDYPSRPIVVVIPLAPGGTTDIMARAVADKMSEALGQRIANRNAGGSGTVGTREVARAAPDGYTILLGYTSTMATGPNIFSNAGYDPRKDSARVDRIGAGAVARAPRLAGSHGRRTDRVDEGLEGAISGRDAGRWHRQLSRFGAVRTAGRGSKFSRLSRKDPIC